MNGVSFVGSTSTTSGGSDVTLSGFNNHNSTAFNSTTAPFGSLSAAYTNILVGADYINGAIAVTVTLNNLTAGHLYAAQVWVNDPRGGSTSTRTETLTSTGGNTNTLHYNSTGVGGGVGQFTIGTFVADAATQSFTLTGDSSTQLNALQVRDVTGAWSGAPITWAGAVTISGDADVATNGSLAYAYDWANNNQTVNGVSFSGSSSLIAGGTNVTLSGLTIQNSTAFYSAVAPFGNLSSAYTNILIGSDYANGSGPVTVTLGNLQVSHSYLVQVWVSDPRGGPTATRSETLTGNGGNTNTLLFNATDAAGGPGQFAIGSFTANSTVESFTLTGGTATQLNALQVRDVTPPPAPPQAQWVHPGTNGLLVYYQDNLGNRLPDFSYAGYEGGGVPLPVVPVKQTITAIGGDNTANVQNAINAVSAMAPDANGFRGAVLLKAGTYTIAGTLSISASGVVLRGEGNNTNTGTVLLVTGLARNVMTVGGSGSWSKTGSTYTITNTYLPLGSTNFYVNDASTFAPGNLIVVQRPQTVPWINAIGMNLLTNPWTAGNGLYFERQVTAVNGNQITVDVPLCNPIEQVWATGQVFHVTDTARIQQVGVENLCAVGQIADYPSNILTGCFLVYQNLKNGWAHDLLLSGWGNGISLNSGVKWCTVQDCQYTNPATGTSSAAPAAWTVGSSGAMCLFQRCNSDGGYYHIMVTQNGTPGPNVFLNFNCTGTHYNGGPHQRWAAGALHDNINMAADSQGGYTPYLAINNRGNDGSGQGWAAGFSVMYNCQVPQFQLEQPNTTTNHYNWVIGGIGSKASYSDQGIYDTLGSIVSPQSLYLEQLKERLGPAALSNIGYPVFSIGATPGNQAVLAGGSASFNVNVGALNGFSDTVALQVAGLPAGATASFGSGSINGSGPTGLTIGTSNSVAPGNYTLTIAGIDGNLTNTATVLLTVQQLHLSARPVSGGNLVLNGSGGIANSGYHVLASTNVSLPLGNWTVVASGNFDGSGNAAYTNSVATSSPNQFFLLRAP